MTPTLLQKTLDLLVVWDTLSDEEIENLPTRLLDAIEKVDIAQRKMLEREGLIDDRRN